MDWPWPRSAPPFLAIIVLIGAGLYAQSRRLDRRFTAPVVLAASTVPHALLVVQGSGIALSRHSMVLQRLVLVVSLAWLGAPLLDGLATGRQPVADPALLACEGNADVAERSAVKGAEPDDLEADRSPRHRLVDSPLDGREEGGR